MLSNLASNLSILRWLYAGGLLLLAIPAWRKGWRWSVAATVAAGIAASMAVQFVPALSGDPSVMDSRAAGAGLVELASLALRWLMMAILVSLACSRPVHSQAKTQKTNLI